VNRHDFDPTGNVIALDQMRDDLVLMKQFGFNGAHLARPPTIRF
jgi:beta-galactosidase/beta-glucuronidase